MTIKAEGQTLPAGSCGIVYTYDAAGNRTQRQYVCNNGVMAIKEILVGNQQILADEIQATEVLYPNPTTGIFNVKLTQSLNNAIVTISDVSGRLVMRKKENGNILNYDLSGQASGEYIIAIKQDGKLIKLKVIIAR